jgi:hypothetical protein
MFRFFRHRFVRFPLVIFLVSWHVGVFVPRQAHAALPLAMIAPAALAGAALLGAGGAAYYAPAVYDAAQKIADDQGRVARLMYRVGKVTLAAGTAHATDYLWGRAVGAYTATADSASALADWVSQNAAEVPALYQAWLNNQQSGAPVPPADVSTGFSVPVGSVFRDVPRYSATYNWLPDVVHHVKTSSDFVYHASACVWESTLDAWGTRSVPYQFTYNTSISQLLFHANYGPNQNGCVDGKYSIYIWKATIITPGTEPATEWSSGGLYIPGWSAALSSGGESIARDLDKSIAAQPPMVWDIADDWQKNFPPGVIPFHAAPPPAWSAGEVSQYIQPATIPWPQDQPYPPPGIVIPQAPAIAPGVIAVPLPVTIVNPNNGAPPIIHAGSPAQIVSVQVGEAVTEPFTDDIPYNPAPVVGPYTLPDVDFAARFNLFLANMAKSPLFQLPGQIVPPEGGSSQIVVEYGQFGGTHTYDLNDLASLWLILNGIFTVAFGYVAIRIVTLKK